VTRLYFDDVGDMRCPECGASFEFINWNSEQEVDIPSFCPVCGRKNANLLPSVQSGSSNADAGLPSAADLDAVMEEERARKKTAPAPAEMCKQEKDGEAA
jgi:NAD-dependent SIR2 family protein deacetylase